VFVPLLRLARIPTAIHVDGIEANRAKWGPVGRAVYRLSERFAGTVADLVITDAEVIRRHYLERYGVDSMMIPYGVDPRAPEGRDVLERLGLRPRGYFLYVSRFEPENNPHRVVAAYRTVPGELPLVMVGSAPYADRFVDELKRSADGRVLFPGAIYGNGYRQLQSEALAYIQATEVGGTHPALVEAMGYGNCILANDTPENREVAGDAALYFEAHRPATLAAQLALVLREPERIASLRLSALERASRRFSWEAVTDAYCTAFEYLIETRRSGKAKIQGVSTDPR
jgi:glycosyltransferase involved in cell wall biosynthesis